jgi:hypothetical protein
MPWLAAAAPMPPTTTSPSQASVASALERGLSSQAAAFELSTTPAVAPQSMTGSAGRACQAAFVARHGQLDPHELRELLARRSEFQSEQEDSGEQAASAR